MLLAAAPDASAKAFKGGVIDATPCQNTNGTCAIDFAPPVPQVGFIDCSIIHDAQLTALGAGYNYCLWMTNNTAANLTTFNFFVPFAAGTVNENDTLECVPTPSGHSPHLTPTGSCAQLQSLHSTDTSFDMTFTANPSFVAQNGTFILAMNMGGAAYADPGLYGPVGVTVGTSVSVPEPGDLGLFGLGLLAIGVGYGWKKRRENRRGRSAV
jgi:hypothetical protein